MSRFVGWMPIFLMVVFGFSACGGGDSPTGPDRGGGDPAPPSSEVAEVNITPEADTTLVERTVSFEATAKDSRGFTLQVDVDWSVTDNEVASIDGNGQVTTRQTGTTTVQAQAGGETASAQLQVTGVSVMVVQPAADTIDINQTTTFAAEITDTEGRVVNGQPTWTSTNTAVAQIEENGQATGASEGETEITAQFRETADTARLVVQDQPVELTAASLDLRPQGLLEGENTTADLVVSHDGGFIEEFDYEIVEGSTVLAQGTLEAPGAGRVDTFTVQQLGPFPAGTHELQLRLDPNDRIAEPEESDNTQTASVRAHPQGDGFNIRLITQGGFDSTAVANMEEATDRWEEVLRGDLADVPTDQFDYSRCVEQDSEGNPIHGVPEKQQNTIDDLLVFVSLETEATGGEPGGAIAHGGPCLVRSDQGGLPGTVVGITVSIDSFDLEEGTQVSTIMHEIGHGLELASGSAQTNQQRLRNGQPGGDPVQVGSSATHQYHQLGGQRAHPPLAVESLAHWRTTGVLEDALMRPFTGGELNETSLGALADMGYAFNYDAVTSSPENGPTGASASGHRIDYGPAVGPNVQVIDPKTGQTWIHPIR